MSDNGGMAGDDRVPSGPPAPPCLALVSDVDEVIRLASLMYQAMGVDASGKDGRRGAAGHPRRRLGDDVMAFVVGRPDLFWLPGRHRAGSIAARLDTLQPG